MFLGRVQWRSGTGPFLALQRARNEAVPSPAFFDASGEDEVGESGERSEVVFGKPLEGFEEMAGKGCVIEDFGDGAGGKVDFFDLAPDDGRGGFFTKRDEDDLARGESVVGMVGENAGALAEGVGGDDLVKHGFIVARYPLLCM